MSSISPIVICHFLNVNPTVHPIKQKKKKFALERINVIKIETEKLLKDDFIWKVYYPDWLSNVVMVKKTSENERCVLTSQI